MAEPGRNAHRNLFGIGRGSLEAVRLAAEWLGLDLAYGADGMEMELFRALRNGRCVLTKEFPWVDARLLFVLVVALWVTLGCAFDCIMV